MSLSSFQPLDRPSAGGPAARPASDLKDASRPAAESDLGAFRGILTALLISLALWSVGGLWIAE